MENKDIKERNEQVKQWLWRYREAKKDVRRLEEELEELTESQESTGAIKYSDMPKGSGSQADLSDYMVEREKLWRKIHKARYKKLQVFAEVKSVIDRLPSADEREIISYRYLRMMDWGLVSVKSKIELRQTYRIHGRALANIYETIKNVIDCH